MSPAAIVWFAALTAICLAGPYVFGVAPRTRRDWFWIAVTLAFLAWILPMMISLRSD